MVCHGSVRNISLLEKLGDRAGFVTRDTHWKCHPHTTSRGLQLSHSEESSYTGKRPARSALDQHFQSAAERRLAVRKV